MNLLRKLLKGLINTETEFSPAELGMEDYHLEFVPTFQRYIQSHRADGATIIFTHISLDNGCFAYKYDFICSGCDKQHLVGFVFGDEEGHDLGLLLHRDETDEFEQWIANQEAGGNLEV